MPAIIMGDRRAVEDPDVVELRELKQFEMANDSFVTEADVDAADAAEEEDFLTKLEDRAVRGDFDAVLPRECNVSMARRKLGPKAGWPYRFHERQ